MENGRTAAHERACARVVSRFGETWLRFYVGRKLRSDPIFPAAFALLRDAREPLVDLGCGVGLLGFYLRERGLTIPIAGLDRDPRKIDRARSAVARGGDDDLEFFEQDVCEFVRQTGNLVLFDVLHYLPPNEQIELLARLVRHIAPTGLLAIRECPRDRNVRFWLTYLAERFAQTTTWNMRAPLHFSTRQKICAPFSPNEFDQSIAPLWGATPFNNHLFIFRRRANATAPAPARRNDNLPASAPAE